MLRFSHWLGFCGVSSYMSVPTMSCLFFGKGPEQEAPCLDPIYIRSLDYLQCRCEYFQLTWIKAVKTSPDFSYDGVPLEKARTSPGGEPSEPQLPLFIDSFKRIIVFITLHQVFPKLHCIHRLPLSNSRLRRWEKAQRLTKLTLVFIHSPTYLESTTI